MKYKELELKAKEAIDTAKKEKAIILMMVDGFQTDKEAFMLRDLMWYARDNGVEIRVIPKKK